MTEENKSLHASDETLFLTVNIVSAYLRNNTVPVQQLAQFIRSVHDALANAGASEPGPIGNTSQPAVPIRKSITPDYLVCLEDGRHLKMLKRYLRSHYKMTPDQYRAKWGLSADYPMVAPNYAQQRSDFAKKAGLGRAAND